MSAAESGTTLTSYRINFVDKDNAWSRLLRMMEHITDTACADTDKHFYEVRTGDGVERNVRLTGHCFGKQSFAGSGMTEQQNSLRNPCAHLLKLCRILQIVDDFRHLLFFFITAGDIIELDLGFGFQSGTGFAEIKRLGICTSDPVHPVHHPDAHDDNNHQRDQRIHQIPEGVARLCIHYGQLTLFQLIQDPLDRRIGCRNRGMETDFLFPFFVRSAHGDNIRPDGQRRFFHFAVFKHIRQLVIAECLRRR